MRPTASEHRDMGGFSHVEKLQVLMLAAVMLLLSVKSDNRFPLPETMPEPLFQLILVPYTVAFVGALAIFITPRRWPGFTKFLSFLDKIPVLRLSVAIALLFEAMTAAILIVENARYEAFGYALDVGLMCALFLLIFAALIALLLKKSLKPAHVLVFAVAAYLGTYLLSIVSFPLNPARSDMLPLIMDAAKNFLAGNSPYAYYLIPPNQLPLTYLPVLWLSYTPAALFSFDPRLINLLCAIGSVLLIYAAAENKQKASALLTIFLLSPYLQYRQDIYLGVLWLLMAALYYSVANRKVVVAAFFMALIAAAYQLMWAIIPFFFIYALRSYDKRTLGKAIIVFLLAAVVVLMPFVARAPDAFANGVFGHWAGQRFVATANVSYIVSLLVGWDRLIFIQAIALSALFLPGLARIDSGARFFGYISVALALFILLSPFIDAYFYLIVLLFLIIYALTPNDPGKAVEPMDK